MTLRQRSPREKANAHLDYIRSLPCLICGHCPCHAAHIRYGCREYGKRPTGAGEKPSDKWTVPLCPDHHVFGPDAQHKRGEKVWWNSQDIDPLIIAAFLFASSGDDMAGITICHAAKGMVIPMVSP